MPRLIKKFWVFILVYVRDWGTRNKPKTKAKTIRTNCESSGQFHFKRQILEKLPEYMRYIRRMKKTDLRGYHNYRRLGALITPEAHENSVTALECYVQDIPAFGAVLFNIDAKKADDDNVVLVPFVYFTKLINAPKGVEPFDGTVFEVMYFMTNIHKKLQSFSTPLYIGVSHGGDVRALRYARTINTTIRHKDAMGGTSVIKTGEIWQHHPYLEGKWHPDDEPSWVNIPKLDDRARFVLFSIINMYITGTAGLRIAATKKDLTAVFTIDMLRTPYFFKDRDAVFDPVTGVKKKIFHIVRTHARQLDKKRIFIKTHFRGLREFTWGGYKILITVPGWHHADMRDFNVAGYIPDDEETLPGWISEEKLISSMAHHIKTSKRFRR